jgi:hypothetical protein
MIITSKCGDNSATNSGTFNVATDPEQAIKHFGTLERPAAKTEPSPKVLTDSLIVIASETSAHHSLNEPTVDAP